MWHLLYQLLRISCRSTLNYARRKQRRVHSKFHLSPAYQLRSRSPCFNTYCSTILQIQLLVQRCVSSFFWVDMSQCAKVRGPIKLRKMGNFLPKSTNFFGRSHVLAWLGGISPSQQPFFGFHNHPYHRVNQSTFVFLETNPMGSKSRNGLDMFHLVLVDFLLKIDFQNVENKIWKVNESINCLCSLAFVLRAAQEEARGHPLMVPSQKDWKLVSNIHPLVFLQAYLAMHVACLLRRHGSRTGPTSSFQETSRRCHLKNGSLLRIGFGHWGFS